jgi:hypothetical protein
MPSRRKAGEEHSRPDKKSNLCPTKFQFGFTVIEYGKEQAQYRTAQKRRRAAALYKEGTACRALQRKRPREGGALRRQDCLRYSIIG